MATITLLDGNDLVNAGDDDDLIDAGGGNDTVNAGGGDDVIYQMYRGSDAIDGGDGNDRLVLDYSGETADFIYSGRGILLYYYDAAGNYLTRSAVGFEVAAPANAARWGIYSANYGAYYTGIEQFDITGTTAMDYLAGGAQADILRGGGGNDVLRGDGGDDLLEGGRGTTSCSAARRRTPCAAEMGTTYSTARMVMTCWKAVRAMTSCMQQTVAMETSWTAGMVWTHWWSTCRGGPRITCSTTIPRFRSPSRGARRTSASRPLI